MIDSSEHYENCSILLVDDDITVRMLLTDMLENEGISVTSVDNGEKALRTIDNNSFDLILLDVKMPGMNGFDVCQAIKSIPNAETIPIIFLTAVDDLESIQEAYALGATDFITKPLVLPIIRHRIQYSLRTTRLLKELQLSEQRLKEAQQIASLGHWEWYLENNTLFWSDEVFKIFGLSSKNEITFTDFINSVHPEDRKPLQQAINQVVDKNETLNIEHRIVLPNGSERVVHQLGKPNYDTKGHSFRMTGTVWDISERRQTEDKIKQLAFYDNLTGLSNRTLFKENANRALQNAERTKSKVALIFLDLDGFKEINDTLGHDAGDELLKIIADHLKKSIRPGDLMTHSQVESHSTSSVSRFGGDEFAILLTQINDNIDAAKVAERVLVNLSKPTVIADHDVIVTGSLGISIYPDDSTEIESLIKYADTAMYHAKKQGKNNFQFFTPAMTEEAVKNFRLLSALKKAIHNEELEVYYQPQINFKTGEIIGLEALLRWHHKELGSIPPEQFIVIAEHNGLIISLGDWVFETVFAQMQQWLSQGMEAISIAINVSSKQFKQPDFVEHLAQIIQKHQLEPNLIVLELTESVIMEDADETIQKMNKIRKLGCHLSVDDFGTGYSSLKYLKWMPLSYIKIDKSFISEITGIGIDLTIARSITALAECLEFKTVIEGVETKEQLKALQKMSSDQLQGFLISPPLPAKAIPDFIELNKRLNEISPGTGRLRTYRPDTDSCQPKTIN